MTDDVRRRFADGVLDRYQKFTAPGTVRVAAGTDSSMMPVGHPDFHHLALGDSSTCELTIAFIDMSRFTARSFWEPPRQVTHLAHAVLTQVALVVEVSGGYVLGLRGDGVMAGWGSATSSAQVDVGLGVAACAVALDACRGALNEMLAASGIEPVQLRAGVDHGRVDLVRIGTPQQSEVNIVGHAANFAAKCEKYANSWEIVVGEGSSQYLSDGLLSQHSESPKRYQYRGQNRTYRFYDLAWSSIVREAVTAIQQVGGRPTSAVAATF